MKLIQLLLPLNDNDGKRFPKSVFDQIKNELADKFDGVTAFSQSPAEGLWDDGGAVQRDQIVLYEIMTDGFEESWWKDFAKRLEIKLKQEKILLRWFDVSSL